MDANELFASKTPMASDLADGLKTLALDQEITFKLYGRVVLPIDGYVFWVRADVLQRPIFQQEGLVSALRLEKDDMSQFVTKAMGSLHYTAETRQEEAENYAANRVVFTTLNEVQNLNAIAPGTMWIGSIDRLRFGFSTVSMRYRQAGIWHYSGFAIYPDMQPQIIDQVSDFSTDQVVSNSLPGWLALQNYAPPYAFWGPLPTLFPSFLVPDNERPPYASVHIVPESTTAMASAPTIAQDSTHTQLCSDHVRITLWGARNTNALDFVDAVYQYSLDTAAFGIMNIPTVRDDKRTQSELGIIAQKKVIDYEVSYLQHRMNDIGRQTIKKAVPNFFVADKPV